MTATTTAAATSHTFVEGLLVASGMLTTTSRRSASGPSSHRPTQMAGHRRGRRRSDTLGDPSMAQLDLMATLRNPWEAGASSPLTGH